MCRCKQAITRSDDDTEQQRFTNSKEERKPRRRRTRRTRAESGTSLTHRTGCKVLSRVNHQSRRGQDNLSHTGVCVVFKEFRKKETLTRENGITNGPQQLILEQFDAMNRSTSAHGFGLFAVLTDGAHDLSLEIGYRGKDAARGDVAFDLVEPGGVRRGEVQMNAREWERNSSTRLVLCAERLSAITWICLPLDWFTTMSVKIATNSAGACC